MGDGPRGTGDRDLAGVSADPRASLRRAGPAIAAAVLAIGELPVLRSLWVPDLNWCYPWLTFDSYDWIHEGVFWSGARVWPTLRPPGLPLVIALLLRARALPILPFLNFAFLAGLAVLLYLFLRFRHSRLVATLGAVFLFTNGFVQDHAKTVMAEIPATFFLMASALAFVVAHDRQTAYRVWGLSLAVGFCFHYAALPAGVAFFAAVCLTRRRDLRSRRFLEGVLLAASLPLAWVAFRSLYAHAHLEIELHGVEKLVGFALGMGQLRFHVLAGAALLGLPALPLVAAGLFRVLGETALSRDPYRIAYLSPLAGVLVFFLGIYKWVDKRFLLYALPFLVCLLAEGFELLFATMRRTLPARLAGAAALVVVLGWNLLRYPFYGADYLALTPRDYLKAGFGLPGARVERLHATWGSAFAGGFFDFALPPPACALADRDYTALPELRRSLDELLPPGAPVAFYWSPPWPFDYWSSVNRLSNVVLRPVVAPGRSAAISVALGAVPGCEDVLQTGPYHVVRRAATAADGGRR